MSCELSEHSALVYRHQVPGGLTEYEYDHVLVGRSLTAPIPNPDEAKSWRWVHPLELQDELSRAPETFTTWFHTIVGRSGLHDISTWAAPSHDPEPPTPVKTPPPSYTPFRLPLWLEEATYPLNPFTDLAQEHTRQWLKNMGLQDTPHASHQQDIYVPGLYAGYMWSEAPLEILMILSDLVGWFSCQDDAADEDFVDPQALEQLIRGIYTNAFTTNTANRQPLAVALEDIIRRAARLMPPLWKMRVGEQYLNYLMPCETALMHRTNLTQPGIDNYENLWQNAGGFQVCLEFTYMVQNIHLPSCLYYSHAWQELRHLALNLFKAVNDLLSFRIMENPDDDIYNLLTHLRHTKSYSPEQAAVEVSQRIERWARQFASAQALLPGRLARLGYDERSQEQALICAQALHNQWRGNIAWHLAAPRYREIRFKGG